MNKTKAVEILYGYSNQGIGNYIEDVIKRKLKERKPRAEKVTVTLNRCLNEFGFKRKILNQKGTIDFYKPKKKSVDKVFEAA